MNRVRLLACPSCVRHVRATERTCPFCAASLPETFAAAPMPQAPTKRLGRAALYAFGATSITVAAACSSASSTPAYGAPVPGDETSDAADEAQLEATAVYGAPAPDGGLPEASDDDATGEPDVTVAPLYGATPVEAGVPRDASGDEIGMGMALYGGPGLFDSGTKGDGASSDASDHDVLSIAPLYGRSP